jgi:hypothetical protein
MSNYEEETKDVLKYLKNNKVASSDSISAELLKNPNLVDALHEIIQQIWNQRDSIPEVRPKEYHV